MKQWLRTLAITGALTGALCVSAGALAYPTDIQYPLEAGGPIQKIYTVQRESEIAQLPRDPFTMGDVSYSYQDTICEPFSDKEEQPLTQTDTLEVDTKDKDTILAGLEQSRMVTTPDGFSGVLTLQPDSLAVEAASYGSKSSTKTLTRTYPNLSDADMNLIPKEASADGRTYSLADIAWTEGSVYNPYDEEVSVRYTAVATYSTQVTSRYAKTYTATVNYTGTVSRTTDEGYRCTLIFYPDSSAAVKDNNTGTTGFGTQLKGLTSVLLMLLLLVAAVLLVLLLVLRLKETSVRSSRERQQLRRPQQGPSKKKALKQSKNPKHRPVIQPEPEAEYPEENHPDEDAGYAYSEEDDVPALEGPEENNDTDDTEEKQYEDEETPNDGNGSGPDDDLLDYSEFGY